MSEVRKVYKDYREQLYLEHPALFRQWEPWMISNGV